MPFGVFSAEEKFFALCDHLQYNARLTTAWLWPNTTVFVFRDEFALDSALMRLARGHGVTFSTDEKGKFIRLVDTGPGSLPSEIAENLALAAEREIRKYDSACTYFVYGEHVAAYGWW